MKAVNILKFFRIRNEKGSITVEASIVMPIFICAVLSIAFFIRIIYVEKLVKHAIDETANELATYSYIYSISGLNEKNEQAVDYLKKQRELFDKQLESIGDSIDFIESSKKDVGQGLETFKSGDIEGIRGAIETAASKKGDAREKAEALKLIFNSFKDDPKKELISLACIFGDNAFKDIKPYAAQPIIRFFIKKHFKDGKMDEDQRLRNLNVYDGFEGLDFSQSKLLDDNKSIELIVRYRINTALPINFLPRVNIIQRSVVLAWLDGDRESNDSKEQQNQEDVWKLAPLERGKKIQVLQGRNLPAYFPVISKFDNKSGEAVAIRSIDLEDATYLKPNNVKTKINSFIKELKAFKGGKSGDVVISESEIRSKKLVIFVPKGTITHDVQAVINKCISESAPVTVIIDESYEKSVKDGQGDKKESGSKQP